MGAIGGLTQKMWAAARAKSDLFIMPMENCQELPSQIPSDMTVAPVNNLDEAIDAIETVTAGGKPAGIERCETP
ncbi:hypothetical protein G7066_09065 [Leucobacter coleopterorum]|uniref:Lon proteolytic domain-containing protein n=1 Tax=Leucobacter coleopterorum TaxID=2714933 RepID=A0ABX6K0W4_9MICO|nr:hypothetical protein G7066_09065 [Leucobacter coleopterorum]